MASRLSQLEKMVVISSTIETMRLSDRRKAQIYYIVALATVAGVTVTKMDSDVQPPESEGETVRENKELSLLLQQVDLFYGRAQQLDPTESYKNAFKIAGDYTNGSPDVLRAKLMALAESDAAMDE